MDPGNQHYVCTYVKKLAQQITPADARLYKNVLLENDGPIRRSGRVELLNPGRKKLDMVTACNMKEVMIFCGGQYIFEDEKEDEEKSMVVGKIGQEDKRKQEFIKGLSS